MSTTIVTIDGPAGAGKSSAARALATRLRFEFLDTGAMFRAVALAGLRIGIHFQDETALACLMANLLIEMPPDRVLLNREDVTGLIRSPEVTAASGVVAVSAVVRRHLADLQRGIAAGRSMVCEGRDQGTVVFPEAACKFFLVADPEERARRRQRDLEAQGKTIDLQAVLEAQEVRDRRDASRDLAPMVPARDARVIDSTHLSLAQVVERMEQEVKRCLGSSPSSGTT